MRKARAALTLLLHAFIVWSLCGATMAIGLNTTSLENSLLGHAVAAPFIAAAVFFVYFSHFNYTGPLVTAITVVAFIVLLDFFLVALVINRSLDMFGSILGTWLPFGLIFGSTFGTGVLVRRYRPPRSREQT